MEKIFIYGKNTLKLILDINPKLIFTIYTVRNLQNDYIFNDYPNKNIEIIYKTKLELDRLSRHGNHQNYIAEVKVPSIYNLSSLANNTAEDRFVIMLDSITDPHNFGAILRVADAVGADALIYAKNRQVKPNSTIAKVSTGAMYSVKLIEVTNLSRSCETLKEMGYWIVGSALSEDAQDLKNYDYNQPICLIIGSEGKGISRNLMNKIDIKVKINMKGRVQSLNAACATGILSYKIKGLI